MTDPTIIAITCTANRADWLEEMARTYSGEQAALVERRILEGENRIELDYAPDVLRNRELGEAAARPRRVVYLVPSWWRRPRDRAKVELTRWRWRRDVRRTRRRVKAAFRRGEQGDAVPMPRPPLEEVDLRGVPTTFETAYTLGRAAINKARLADRPVRSPVLLRWTDPVGHDYQVRLP